jgi:hypothetical protein
MPIRFPTEAANDPGMPRDVGADGTPRGRADGTPEPPDKRKSPERNDDAKPGKDINQAGFVRERDSRGED